MLQGSEIAEKKPKRVPGSSGRLHKNEDGDWEWSDDEYSSTIKSQDKLLAPSTIPASLPVNENTISSSDVTPAKEAGMEEEVVTSLPPAAGESQQKIEKKYNFNLRVRTEKNQSLQDIKFEFVVGQDTPDGVSQELVAVGLIEGKDKIVVAANVSKLVDSPDFNKNVKFPLSGSLMPNQFADEKNLIGFGSLTLLPP